VTRLIPGALSGRRSKAGPHANRAHVVCPTFRVGERIVRTVAMVARFDHRAETTLDEPLYPMDEDADQFFGPQPHARDVGRALPHEGIDPDGVTVHAQRMNPRHGVIAGATIAALVAVVLVVTPAAWLADMLVAGPDATTFLLRRYAASATAALAVVTIATARHTDPKRAVLLGLSTWFGVQTVTAWWGIIGGAVGGFAWLAMFADPLVAAWFLFLSRKSSSRAASGRARR
jgi:hypothetical protein